MVRSLSVVIPAYNEEANIAKCVKSIHAVLKKSKLDWEIIIVDDGSNDKTGAIAKSLAKTLPRTRLVTNRPNRGYGGSLKAGFAASSKEFIAFFPADNQFDFSEITLLTDTQADQNADIVSGIRLLGGADPLYRKINRWGWSSLVRALFGYLATDIDCGFKLFRKVILDHISLPAERGAMIDTQLFAGARARGFTVAEVPLTHLPRTAGKSTGANLKVIYQSFVDLVSFWWHLKQEIWVEQGRAVFRWEALILVLILALASFLRLYQIDRYLTFLGDEGRDAIAMYDIVTLRHFPLIGPGTSIGNMYLGPWYYYLAAPSLALFNFSPAGPAVFVAVLGVLTVALLWWVGRQWFGRVPALAVTLLYSLSPTVITYSRSSWNPNIMPFFALLSIYGIWKVWKLGYWRWLTVTAACFAIALNSHYLGLLLAPSLGLFWLLAISRKTHSTAVRYTLISLAVLMLLMSPLLLFDLRHNWQNFSAVSRFFTDRQTTVNLKAYKALPHIWPVWQDITASLLAAKQSLPATSVSLFLAVSSLLVLLHRRTSDFKLVLVWLGVGLVGLGLYKQHIYDHYYGFLFPAPFLLLGFTLQYLAQNRLYKIVALMLLILLVTLAVRNSPLRYPPNNQLENTRRVAEFIIDQSAGSSFNLALIAKSNYDASYRYFLYLRGAPYLPIRHPQTGQLQITGQLFVVCESLPCQPVGHPLAEIATFGWAKIGQNWSFPWGVELYRLIPNPSGQ